MSARVFLDTNVLVYTFDSVAVSKRDRARELVERSLADRTGFISFQVAQEFLNVATRKFARPLGPADARAYLERVLGPLCEVMSSVDLYRKALLCSERWGYGLYDALVIVSAIEGGARTLLTEDLQHGQLIEGLEIRNPFRGI